MAEHLGLSRHHRFIKDKAILLLLVAGLAGVVYNAWLIFDEACGNAANGFRNLDNGKPFSCAWGYDFQLLEIAERNIPKGSSVYYWTIPELEKEISTECQAIALNYYLHPVTVHYRNCRNIGLSDYVITEIAFKTRLEQYMVLLGFSESFSEHDKSHRYVILKNLRASSYPWHRHGVSRTNSLPEVERTGDSL